jgi:hypothetical protein
LPEQLAVTLFVFGGYARHEGQRAPDFETTGRDLMQAVDPLTSGGRLQLSLGDELAPETCVVNFPVLDQDIGVALQPSSHLRVRVEVAHHYPVDDQQCARADHAAEE